MCKLLMFKSITRDSHLFISRTQLLLKIDSNAKVKEEKAVFKNIFILFFKFPFVLMNYRHEELGFT